MTSCAGFSPPCAVALSFPLVELSRLFFASSLTSAILLTSLAFLNPHCCPEEPRSLGRSTATKLARTLLTGRLGIEDSDAEGDLPRLGGETGGSLPLFSNIARRLRTPPLLEVRLTEDMAASRPDCQLRCFTNGVEKGSNGLELSQRAIAGLCCCRRSIRIFGHCRVDAESRRR